MVHDVFFLALGHHHHGSRRVDFLDALQCLETGETGHHFVEKHQVEGALRTLFYGIGTIGYGNYLVAFLLKKQDVGTQQFYLVIDP